MTDTRARNRAVITPIIENLVDDVGIYHEHFQGIIRLRVNEILDSLQVGQDLKTKLAQLRAENAALRERVGLAEVVVTCADEHLRRHGRDDDRAMDAALMAHRARAKGGHDG
jgi:hypothetical protein